jgi:hypothetical protein
MVEQDKLAFIGDLPDDTLLPSVRRKDWRSMVAQQPPDHERVEYLVA